MVGRHRVPPPAVGEVIPVAIPDNHQMSMLQSKSATRVPTPGSPLGSARAADPWPMKMEKKREHDQQNQQRIEHSRAGQVTDMTGHYQAQSAQMWSQSVDTWQLMVPRCDSVGAVSAGSSAEGLGWGNRAFRAGASGFGASSASGTGWGIAQQQSEQFLPSRGWKPIPRATSTPNRSGSLATPSLQAQGVNLGGQGSQGGHRRRQLFSHGYTRYYKFESDLPDQKEQEVQT